MSLKEKWKIVLELLEISNGTTFLLMNIDRRRVRVLSYKMYRSERRGASTRNTFSRTIKFHGYVNQRVRGEGMNAFHCWHGAEATINSNKEAWPSGVRRSGLGCRGSLIILLVLPA